MTINSTAIADLLIIKPDVFSDNRGYFMESYNAGKYATYDIPFFVQDNESQSTKGVMRGLHYQMPPYAQGKLVRVVEGEVFDVAVDIRPGSPTFGKYESVILSSQNKLQFWIPAGFAHGFVTLSESAIFSYKCTAPYNKDAERSIRWNDPDIAIEWPMHDPLISEKDELAPLFADAVRELDTKQNPI